MPNAAQIGHELTNLRRFVTIREIVSHDSYKKKAHPCFVSISSKFNDPHIAALELILQL